MALQFTTSYLEDSLTLFRYYKKLAERAMEQVTDEQLFAILDEESNSIGIVSEAHSRQYAVPLDRFLDVGRGEAGPRSRQRICRSTRYTQGAVGCMGGRLDALVPSTGAAVGCGPRAHGDH